jgi:hypothetical protein
MSVLIPTVWCPYCDSANELNCKRCWRCRQRIPAQAERTGGAGPAAVSALPAPVAASTGLARVTAAEAAPAPPLVLEVERKQCAYCREWIDPQASVCPYCRTDQGAIAAVQRATWAFMQLFFCFAALGTGVVVLIRLCQWGMAGRMIPGL